MSDDSLIRRENFRKFCAQRGLGPTELAANERLTGRYTYWREVLADGPKSFGEKKIREIEAAFVLPRGYFDEPLEDDAIRHPPKGRQDPLSVLKSGTAAERKQMADTVRLIAVRNRGSMTPEAFEATMQWSDEVEGARSQEKPR